MAHRIKKMLSRANIEVVHSIPGRIRLKNPRWKNPAPEMKELFNKLSKESEINSVVLTQETGTLLVEFNVSVLDNPVILENWINRVEQTLFNAKAI